MFIYYVGKCVCAQDTYTYMYMHAYSSQKGKTEGTWRRESNGRQPNVIRFGNEILLDSLVYNPIHAV